MKKIYLVTMYMKWSDVNTPTEDYRDEAKDLIAFKKKKDALESLKHMIKQAKQTQCSLYKKYFFIKEIELR